MDISCLLADLDVEKQKQTELQTKLQEEQDEVVRLNRALEAAQADLKYANDKNKRMQDLLDESRQVEAATKQQLGDLQVRRSAPRPALSRGVSARENT